MAKQRRFASPRPLSTLAPKGHIVIGIPSRGVCESHFARTLSDLVLFDATRGQRHLHPERPVVWTIGATQIVVARNILVDKFLENETADWLLMLDDDQVYPKELLEHMIAAADPELRPIVGVPVWRYATDGNGGPVRVTHNVLDITDANAFVEWTEPLPPNAVVQVPAIGTGCMIVHRSVFLKMRQWCIDNGQGAKWGWFRHNVYQPADMAEGEDLYFCRLAASCGFPVFAATFTTLGHVKRMILEGPVPPGLVAV